MPGTFSGHKKSLGTHSESSRRFRGLQPAKVGEEAFFY